MGGGPDFDPITRWLHCSALLEIGWPRVIIHQEYTAAQAAAASSLLFLLLRAELLALFFTSSFCDPYLRGKRKNRICSYSSSGMQFLKKFVAIFGMFSRVAYFHPCALTSKISLGSTEHWSIEHWIDKQQGYVRMRFGEGEERQSRVCS